MKKRAAVAVAAVTAVLLSFLVVSGTQTAVASETRTGTLYTAGSQIKDAEGDHIIKAVSWFGMETETCSPHGLWQVSLDSVLSSIKEAGFNTIRFPYANECLHRNTVTGVNSSVNPELSVMTPLQLMDTVITEADRYGLDIILDRHRPGVGGQSELWYTAQVSEQQWINDWEMLAARYINQTNVIGADLHNEPHGSACWGCGSAAYDWKEAAERAGNAVLDVNPNLLIIVEGTEKNNNGTKTTWWGGGLWHADEHPVELKNPNKLVYSVHDYPSTIWNQSWFSDPNYPNNLTSMWDENWGYLQQENIAPVFVGEFGTKYEKESDKQWLSELVEYMDNHRMSWGFWAYNPNSGDTGGVVKDDWVTYETAKLDALNGILTPLPTPPVPTDSPTTPEVKPTPEPSDTPTTGTSPTPNPENPTTPTPTPTKTQPVPTHPSQPSSPPAPPASNGSITAQWKLQSGWGQGYVAELTLTGTADTWRVVWNDPTATGIVNAWGMKCNLTNGTITCEGTDWAKSISDGQKHQVGLQVSTMNGTYNKTPALNVTSSVNPPSPSTPVNPPAPSQPSKADVSWKLQSGWEQGYVAELTVKGEANSWRVVWNDPTATGIVNAWGMKCNLTNGTITCEGTDWVTSLKQGQTYQVGLQVSTMNGTYNRTPTLNVTSN